MYDDSELKALQGEQEIHMKNVIIGTAGHVDHGKTLLIKALTGMDTDRLIEEKKRGITIELGFAHMDLPGGEKAGIIDVPGHERFIKNMLAGAGGMDMVLLVVAADEGVMPQTREHLNILTLLDISHGIVVLTKTDLVSEEWIGLVMEDLKNELKGSFLESAPIIPVSSVTGEGIDELKQTIFKLVQQIQSKDMSKPFRIPVDRVFTVEGFGTVVTGTLIEGTVFAGEEVSIYPGERRSRVRNIQVYGKNVEIAYAGQRVAVNLAALKKEEIQRGDTLAKPGSMDHTMLLDVSLRLFTDTKRSVKNGDVLHFYHGSLNILCKAVLIDRDRLGPGEKGYAQLRLSESIAVKNGDSYVVRFYSPLETIGGGKILDACPRKHRRNDPSVIESYKIKESGTTADKILLAVKEYAAGFETVEQLGRRLNMDTGFLRQEIAINAEKLGLVKLSENIVLNESYVDSLRSRLTAILKEYHEKNPLHAGMRRDELRSRLLPGCTQAVADMVIDLFISEKVVRADQQRIALYGFNRKVSDSHQKLLDEIEKKYLAAGYFMPSIDEVQSEYSGSREMFRQVIQLMLDRKILINITSEMFIHREFFKSAFEIMKKIQEEKGSISLGEFRDRIAASRKYALPILEYCDSKNITKKTGDLRRINKIDLEGIL